MVAWLNNWQGRVTPLQGGNSTDALAGGGQGRAMMRTCSSKLQEGTDQLLVGNGLCPVWQVVAARRCGAVPWLEVRNKGSPAGKGKL